MQIIFSIHKKIKIILNLISHQNLILRYQYLWYQIISIFIRFAMRYIFIVCIFEIIKVNIFIYIFGQILNTLIKTHLQKIFTKVIVPLKVILPRGSSLVSRFPTFPVFHLFLSSILLATPPNYSCEFFLRNKNGGFSFIQSVKLCWARQPLGHDQRSFGCV